MKKREHRTETRTANVFEAILGRKAIKWDAFWHLFEWLLDSGQGHELGDSIRLSLIRFAFGEAFSSCCVKREHPVSGQTDGKGKWVDYAVGIPDLKQPEYLVLMDDIGISGSGGQRKLKNLMEYLDLSRQLHPNARIRVVAVSDALTVTDLAAVVQEVLGSEAAEYAAVRGWRLLPLQTIGQWVQTAIDSKGANVSDRAKANLEEFVEWCGCGLNSREVEQLKRVLSA